MGIIIQILITMAFSAFFSGMEIAFVSSNKLRFEMDRNNQSINSRILSIFFHNPNNFISTMLVGNNIALVIYGILMAQVIEQNLLSGLIDNHFLLVLIQTIISTLIILVTGEFLPKTLFKINPNFTLNIFAVPTYICYVLLYPISKFASGISNILLYIVGIKTNKEANEKAFTKVDLDYFIQSSIQDVQNEQTGIWEDLLMLLFRLLDERLGHRNGELQVFWQRTREESGLNKESVGKCVHRSILKIMEEKGAGSEYPVEYMRLFIRENYRQDISVQEFAEKFYMNKAYLGQKFKKATGVSVNDYLQRIRIEEAVRLADRTELSWQEIAVRVGYVNYITFLKYFVKQRGSLPSDYRK